ncbi:hypothetical protein BOTBODRAFT_434483 [Botryobasidium botryosum FD-172 SS1]|uniref:Uncharacterized protein n=1 Tax=Botryobasidium botryosum (strain FD-172 SS1) TaxID=930990 RepID=A0A067N685_BOTB1|nr:hypothetical protein BOTBODRAFT_434483 [Botryobasidium botryosum FD-172 SS1]
MGNRGYKVYRHKERYFVDYYDRGCEPSALGIAALSEIPRGDVFQRWLARKRSRLDTKLKEWVDRGCPVDGGDPDSWIAAKRPIHDVFIEWVKSTWIG